jgi:magnesium transporter
MISYFKSENGKVQKIESMQPGCWVDVVEPTAEERLWLQTELEIVPEFVRSAFDDEETAHVDFDEDTDQVLVIVDCPFVEDESEMVDKSIVQYDTHPLSFVFVPEQEYFVTLSLRRNETIADFAHGRYRDVYTGRRTRFLLQMLLRITQRYLVCLRSINRQIREYERSLRKNMRNTELMKMLGLEKSLVYFSTSLKGLESTATKIGNGRMLDLYEEDHELLDDVKIEIRQAMEMCTIYTNILNGITDTFSSVISNNLNMTMRTLTVITLVMAIPTIIFSFYGMNVEGLPLIEWFWFPVVLAGVCCVIAGILLKSGRFLK